PTAPAAGVVKDVAALVIAELSGSNDRGYETDFRITAPNEHFSFDFRSMRNHVRCEKRLGHFAFTNEKEFRKSLVPLSSRYFRIGIQPILQCIEVRDRNPIFTKALNEMLHEVRRGWPPNFRHSDIAYGTQ